MTALAISSFSLHRELGPLHIQTRDSDGILHSNAFPMPALHTLEDFVRDVRDRFDVGAVELCQIQIRDASPERLHTLRDALEAANVHVLTIPIDAGNLSDTDPQHREEDIATILGWLDVAQALGATFARVNTGTPHQPGPTIDIDGLVDALTRIAVAAQARGLQLLIENHGGASSDPDHLLAVRDAVGPDNLGILLDLGNFEPLTDISAARMMGEKIDDLTVDTEPVYQRIAQLAPHASLVHAKAYDPRSDGTPLLDLDRALSIVAATGYTGPISIEWEGTLGDPWAHTGHTLDAVRRAFPNLGQDR